MIAVFGATGDLGSRIVRLLRAEGHPVRAVSRERRRLDAAVALGAEPVIADLRRPETLGPALRGVEVVITTANAVLGRGDNGVREVDLEGNAALIDHSRAAGVQRFVLVSALGCRPDHPADFFRAKAAAGARLESSGMSGAIVLAAAFMEVWAGMLGDPVVSGRPVLVFGRGQNPVSFVASDDVARVTVALATGPHRPGVERVELGGPEAPTVHEVVALFASLSGQRPRIRHVPRTVLRAAPPLLRPFAPVPARLMSAALWMDTADQRLDPTSATARFGPLVSLEDFARARVSSATRGARPEGASSA